MVQIVWIGITVGVFAGLGIGYAVFHGTPTNLMQMPPQQMQQMMNEPNFRQQMMTQWKQKPADNERLDGTDGGRPANNEPNA